MVGGGGVGGWLTSGVQGGVLGVGEEVGLRVEIVQVGGEVGVCAVAAGGGVQGADGGLVFDLDVGQVLQGWEGEGWRGGAGWVAGGGVGVSGVRVVWEGWGCGERCVLAGDGEPDVDVEAAVFGREGEVRGSRLERGQVLVDLGHGGGIVGEDPRYELEGVGVPVLAHVGSFERGRDGARWRGLGEAVQSPRQLLLVDTGGTPLLRQVPVREVVVFVGPVEGVVDGDPVREEGLGDAQDLAAVGSVAVFGAVRVHVLLEPVVEVGRVGGGRREAPAHVLLARCIVSACVFVDVVLGDLVELSTDVVGDVFDDLGVGVGVGKVVAQEGLVEGEDAFDFDAEGDLEGGVDHVDGFFVDVGGCSEGNDQVGRIQAQIAPIENGYVIF